MYACSLSTQEEYQFKASLGYTVRLAQNTTQKSFPEQLTPASMNSQCACCKHQLLLDFPICTGETVMLSLGGSAVSGEAQASKVLLRLAWGSVPLTLLLSLFQMYRLTLRTSKDTVSQRLCELLSEQF